MKRFSYIFRKLFFKGFFINLILTFFLILLSLIAIKETSIKNVKIYNYINQPQYNNAYLFREIFDYDNPENKNIIKNYLINNNIKHYTSYKIPPLSTYNKKENNKAFISGFDIIPLSLIKEHPFEIIYGNYIDKDLAFQLIDNNQNKNCILNEKYKISLYIDKPNDETHQFEDVNIFEINDVPCVGKYTIGPLISPRMYTSSRPILIVNDDIFLNNIEKKFYDLNINKLFYRSIVTYTANLTDHQFNKINDLYKSYKNENNKDIKDIVLLKDYLKIFLESALDEHKTKEVLNKTIYVVYFITSSLIILLLIYFLDSNGKIKKINSIYLLSGSSKNNIVLAKIIQLSIYCVISMSMTTYLVIRNEVYGIINPFLSNNGSIIYFPSTYIKNLKTGLIITLITFIAILLIQMIPMYKNSIVINLKRED
ncbi:MAG: hypothetical protein ACTTID_03685 [Bacillales bacterium]